MVSPNLIIIEQTKNYRKNVRKAHITYPSQMLKICRTMCMRLLPRPHPGLFRIVIMIFRWKNRFVLKRKHILGNSSTQFYSDKIVVSFKSVSFKRVYLIKNGYEWLKISFDTLLYLNDRSPSRNEAYWWEIQVSGWEDLNLRSPAPKAGALTGLRYTPKYTCKKRAKL